MTEENLIEVPDLLRSCVFRLAETGLIRTLAEVEAEYIRNVLASANSNKTRAAEILGIDRRHFGTNFVRLKAHPLLTENRRDSPR